MSNVFVTVGTHKQPFDRLPKKIDSLKTGDKFFVQSGNCGYRPQNVEYSQFLSPAEVRGKTRWADIIVSHCGAGSIINALSNRKALILIPRLKKFNEHTDDHQLELARALEKEGKAIVIYSVDRLPEALEKARDFRPDAARNRAGLVKAINNYLGSLEKEGN